ncbi:MAG TPA: TerB family tellurite resistance protein [Beijerinckiaceae bacterium]|jgi:tellurite resistance protein|nr:TerB family tellurite resistance protein [Beijerinckiaceae bacterium]
MQVDAVAQIVANWRFPVSNTISISNVTQYERKLIEAVAAAYALIAHSDGEPAGIERQQLFTILRNRPALSSLPRTEIAQASAVHEANFRLDPEIAQEIAREKLIAIADESAASDIILALCRELIAADGVLHPAERRQFREIKTLLGVTRTPAA